MNYFLKVIKDLFFLVVRKCIGFIFIIYLKFLLVISRELVWVYLLFKSVRDWGLRFICVSKDLLY